MTLSHSMPRVDYMRRVANPKRYRRQVGRLTSDDVELRRFFGLMSPPPLQNWERPSSPFVSLARRWQASGRPQLRLHGVLQDSTPFAELFHGPEGQFLFAWPWFRHVREPRPSAARRMSYERHSARPVERVPLNVPHIAFRHCLVDRIGPGEYDRHTRGNQALHTMSAIRAGGGVDQLWSGTHV